MRPLALALFASLAVPATGQADVVRSGRTFAITLHPHELDDGLAAWLADEALAAAAEAMRPVLDRLGVPPPKGAMLHVHVGPASFRAAETKCAPYPFQVTEFADADGREAHVCMTTPLRAQVLQAIGLPPGTARRLQWCAALVAARQASANVKQDPWLGDVVAFGAVDALVNPKAVGGIEPWYDERRMSYAHYGFAKLAPILEDTQPIDSVERLTARAGDATVVAQLFAGASLSWVRKVLVES